MHVLSLWCTCIWLYTVQYRCSCMSSTTSARAAPSEKQATHHVLYASTCWLTPRRSSALCNFTEPPWPWAAADCPARPRTRAKDHHKSEEEPAGVARLWDMSSTSGLDRWTGKTVASHSTPARAPLPPPASFSEAMFSTYGYIHSWLILTSHYAEISAANTCSCPCCL